MTADFSRLLDDLEGGSDTGSSPPVSSVRRVVIVLLDTSFSMTLPANEAEAGTAPPVRRIDMLNGQLREWLPMVRDAGHGTLRDVEFAVVAFGGRGTAPVTGSAPGARERWHEDAPPAGRGVFVAAADLQLPELAAFGTTHLVTAVNLALDLGEARVRSLAGRGIGAEQVRILLFGDGGSYDKDQPADALRSVTARLDRQRSQGRACLFAFGPPGADEAVLRALAGDDGYVPLGDFDFGKLLELIFRAAAARDPLAAIRREFGGTEPGP